MTEPAPPSPPRPTSHRAAAPSSDVIRRFAPPLVAVAAVVVVILLLLVLNARPTPPGPAPGAVAQRPTGATAPALSSPPTLSASSSPASQAVSTVAAPPVSEPPATQPPATQAPAQAARPAVTVLNNSRRSGLAADAAAQVRATGWPVAKTGNFRGRISVSTLYYVAGQRGAAQQLARQLPQIRRIEPRFAGLPGRGMTLVVTREWSA